MKCAAAAVLYAPPADLRPYDLARDRTCDSDGAVLASSRQAGPGPESPLARARGSVRAALSDQPPSLASEGRNNGLLRQSDTAVRKLGSIQGRHSSFDPKIDIIQLKQYHLARL